MSSGVFVRAKYQATYGGGTNIHPIRVQPETLDAVGNSETNDEPAGAINNPISAQISKGRRAKGLTPRYITIQFPLTGQPAGYKAGGITRIPALTEPFFEAQVTGATINYLGVDCEVVSTTAEEAR